MFFWECTSQVRFYLLSLSFSLRITFGDVEAPASNRAQWELNETMPATGNKKRALRTRKVAYIPVPKPTLLPLSQR